MSLNNYYTNMIRLSTNSLSIVIVTGLCRVKLDYWGMRFRDEKYFTLLFNIIVITQIRPIGSARQLFKLAVNFQLIMMKILILNNDQITHVLTAI